MLTNPKVSVVIPCFNDAEYLEEAVDSVLNQGVDDIEVLVVNDGSTDLQTIKILNNFSKPKTKIFHKENGHVSSARNFGIAKAKANYILTLDADDYYKKGFLRNAISILDNEPSIGAVICYVKGFGNRSFLWKPKGGDLKNFIVYNQALSSALFRKECWEKVGGFDEEMKRGYQDWEFWLRVTNEGWNIDVIKKALYMYRQRSGSMITKSNKKRKEIVRYMMAKHPDLYLDQFADAISKWQLRDYRTGTTYTDLLKLFVKKVLGRI